MKEQDWIHDINQLETELPQRHANFFKSGNKEIFYEEIKQLKKDLTSLDVYEIVLRLSKIVATAKDAHTAVMIPQSQRLPFEIDAFEEGIYIIATNKKYQHLLYRKILKIEEDEIEAVIEKIKEVIPHENDQFILATLPNFMTCVDILYGAAIISAFKNISITLEDPEGKTKTIRVDAIGYGDYIKKESSKKMPLFMQWPEKFYWSHLEDGLFYINYGKCKDMEDYPVFEFREDLRYELLTNREIKKVVLDFRHNMGGNSSLFLPFLQWLSAIYTQDVYVIVGRNTFSSALLNVYYLKLKDRGIFLGEPTGGKPNCFGEVRFFKLKYSELRVRYSTRYYEIIKEDQQLSFIPDRCFQISFIDYLEGRDLCMEWIKNTKINAKSGIIKYNFKSN